jgi:hypothetical protein
MNCYDLHMTKMQYIRIDSSHHGMVHIKTTIDLSVATPSFLP